MIKKATLIKENEKLKREIFIWKNIGIGMNASTKEKEIATKEFLEGKGLNFLSTEVCMVPSNTIDLNEAQITTFTKMIDEVARIMKGFPLIITPTPIK